MKEYSNHTGIDELSLELIVAAKGLVNELSKFTRGFATTIGFHAVPIEGVVECLSGIIE